MKLVDALIEAVSRIEAAELAEDEILTFEFSRGYAQGVRVHVWSPATLERIARNAGLGRYRLTRTTEGSQIFRLQYVEGPEPLMFLAYADPDGSTKGQAHIPSDWLLENATPEVATSNQAASVAPVEESTPDMDSVL